MGLVAAALVSCQVISNQVHTSLPGGISAYYLGLSD